MKQRALWLVSLVTDQEGLTMDLINAIFNLMHTSELPVQLEAAITLSDVVSDQTVF